MNKGTIDIVGDDVVVDKRRKVIFVSNSLVVGGIERSLLAILDILPPDIFDVTLMLVACEGPLLEVVPPHVKVVKMPLAPLDRFQLERGRVPALKYFIRHGHFVAASRMLFQRFLWNIMGRTWNFDLTVIRSMMKRLLVCQGVDGTKFDYALAYAGGFLTGSYVLTLNAKVKAIWCHDESAIGTMPGWIYNRLYVGYDHCFGTGDFCSKVNEGLGDVPKKFEVIPYLVDVGLISRLANSGMGFEDDYNGIRILTVGRICHQKGIDQAIEIASRLTREGLDFKWYVIGGGGDASEFVRQIQKEGLEERFILLGEKLNPFPYFAQCDIYAQPSRYEAFCLTVSEARSFNKPIIVTDFVGAREQLKDRVTGLIVALNDLDAFTNGLKRLLLDAELRNFFSRNLAQESADQIIAAKIAWSKLLGEAL